MRTSLSVLAITTILLSAGCSNPEASDGDQIPRTVAWAEARLVSGNATLRLAGFTRSKDRARLAFQVAGVIDDVSVRVGERFQQGDVLARLDPEHYELQLAATRSELAQARAEADEARRQLQRDRELFSSGARSQREIDRSRTADSVARERVARLESMVRQAERRLADTTLRAPFDGTVASRLIEPAQWTTAGAPALEIHGRGGIEVALAVSETSVDRIALDAAHEVRFPGLNLKDVVGRVAEVGVDATIGGAYPVTLLLENPPELVSAGQAVDVTLVLKNEVTDDAQVEIPVSALDLRHPGSVRVLVYDPGTGSLDAREVKGLSIEGQSALLRRGLLPGEIVATHGISFLVPGEHVNLLGQGVARFNQ